MIKEVLKALVGVGRPPETPFEPSPKNILIFAILLLLCFLGTVTGALFLTSLVLR
tara:strand:- start:3519 stop:3683 length:165 start_codon:yes stop_codon:yes gene_type:complete